MHQLLPTCRLRFHVTGIRSSSGQRLGNIIFHPTASVKGAQSLLILGTQC
jgi:hypothetical protein